MSTIDAAVDRLMDAGWLVARADAPSAIPLDVVSRYPWVDKSLWSALAGFRSVCRPDERAWLLVANDFGDRSGSVWAWNAWELLTLEDVDEGSSEARAIRAFWDDHFPVAMAVDPYSYWALRRDGAVVFGAEPEFEVTTHVADSYVTFLSLLAELQPFSWTPP